MSDELSPVPVGEQAPATQLSAEEIVEIKARLARAIAGADAARDLIRKTVGPQPGKAAQDMLISINQATGHLRVCHDAIEAMFARWKRCLLQRDCPHDHGFRPHTRDFYFCKRCDLQFTLQQDGTLAPSEIQL